ncbi:MAG: iron-containing alcohol dehydrogenase family protein [Dehalococcoidia bacterium]|nr:iron-containing alcohol dehydrogenase family protein [Dehalococcoidia bacterium]
MPSDAPFRYRSSGFRIFAGEDALANLLPEVERAGVRRAFAVCGRSIATGTDLLDRVRAVLGDRYSGSFERAQAQSPLPSVLEGVEAARAAGGDAIVAIGGGSATVTARGIAILMAEQGTARELATKYPPGQRPVSPRLDAPKAPNFLVLTTPTSAMARAGTALIDPERQHRLEMFDPKTRAAAVFWDTAALLTAPAALFLSAAVATYTQIVTGLATTTPNPIADGDRQQALRLFVQYMPRIESDGSDGAARQQLMAAAFLTNRSGDVDARGGGGGGFGALGSIAHSLDTRYGNVGHGESYAIVTPHVLRYNLAETAPQQARLARVIGAATAETPEAEAAAAAAPAVEATLTALGMPRRMRDVAVPEDGLELLAADAMEDFGLGGNARSIASQDDLMPLLREMW